MKTTPSPVINDRDLIACAWLAWRPLADELLSRLIGMTVRRRVARTAPRIEKLRKAGFPVRVVREDGIGCYALDHLPESVGDREWADARRRVQAVIDAGHADAALRAWSSWARFGQPA